MDEDEQLFPQILARLALVAQMIDLLEGVRDDLIRTADETSPQADRQQIATAAGMPSSSLYRLLPRLGRPVDRRGQQ